MRRIFAFHLAFCVIFAVGALAFFAYYKFYIPPPPLLKSNEAFVERINSIQDIEHLRKLLIVVVNGSDSSVLADRAALDATVHLLVAIMLIAAWAFSLLAYKCKVLPKTGNTNK